MTAKAFVNISLNSLKVRLVISSMLLTLTLIPVLGLALQQSFENHLKTAIKNELVAYSYSILAVLEVENNQLLMPEVLLEPQFNVSQSGLYAIINGLELGQKPIWQSSSLLGLLESPSLQIPPRGQRVFFEQLIQGTSHLVVSYSLEFDQSDGGFPFTIHIIKDLTSFFESSSQFTQKIVMWLSMLLVLLIVVQLIWLFWTLKPLRNLQQELLLIESGTIEQLQYDYPTELASVTEQLHSLLKTEQNQRVRYRNALSDLAHSLKTPLAVMQSESNISGLAREQLEKINKTIEHQLTRAQSAGESSWHLGFKVYPSTDKLLRTMQKIHAEKAIDLTIHIEKNLIFKGDEADWLEVLGNLLDNAFKAANAQVKIRCFNQNHQLFVCIEDDGKGIDERLSNQLLQRGERSDTYQVGHGIGLAIVSDIVKSYQGVLHIHRSKTLGGAKVEVIFSKK